MCCTRVNSPFSQLPSSSDGFCRQIPRLCSWVCGFNARAAGTAYRKIPRVRRSVCGLIVRVSATKEHAQLIPHRQRTHKARSFVVASASRHGQIEGEDRSHSAIKLPTRQSPLRLALAKLSSPVPAGCVSDDAVVHASSLRSRSKAGRRNNIKCNLRTSAR